MGKTTFWVEKAWDIWTVGKHRNVDTDVAYDMYRTDVHYGDDHEYNTGDTFPADYDWKGLQAQWFALTADEQKDCYEAWHDFVKLYYALLCRAFTAGDKVKFDSYIKDYVG